MAKRSFLSKMFLACVFYYVALLALVVNHFMPFFYMAYAFSNGVVEDVCNFCNYDRPMQWYAFVILSIAILALPVLMLRAAAIFDNWQIVRNFKKRIVFGI